MMSLNVKLVWSLAVLCLALDNGLGAPTKARYMFVRCNPNGDQANCVSHRSPAMKLSPDLPSRLPASATQYMEAEPVLEEEEPVREEEFQTSLFPEEGSGGFMEGSAVEPPLMADQAFILTQPKTGSGDTWLDSKAKLNQGVKGRGLELLVGEAGPPAQELKEDYLLL